MRLNLNQKRERALQADNKVQVELYKRRKVSEVLKGTYDSLSAKEKQLAKSQYQASKFEINYKDQIKKLQDQLEVCKKGLKE